MTDPEQKSIDAQRKTSLEKDTALSNKSTSLGTVQQSGDLRPESPKDVAVKALQESPLVKNKNVELSEDSFGTIFDENGTPRTVKRFTWKNQNNIEVQIITYGARISSMKLPDRKGHVVDIVMGFDDLAGYIYYDKHYFGATIGRMSNVVENSTFAVHGKQYWLTQNEPPHHTNGGTRGLDKVIWNHFVDGAKVILTYISYDKDQGYPGDLLLKIEYELSSKNEFSIKMEAVTTKPTIINLSNMNYINLAGHNMGPEELYKHMVTINANCYTAMNEKGFPKGEIFNVNYTKNDFQIPKIMSNLIGLNDEDGYDQNLCVNKGVDQENAFVSRILHVPSGRLLEMYSNQWGVNLYTADRLGSGTIDIPVDQNGEKLTEKVPSPFDLVNKLHAKIKDTLEMDKESNYSEMRSLIRKIQGCQVEKAEELLGEEEGEEEAQTPPNLADLNLTSFQLKYLDQMKDITDKAESLTDYSEIKDIINKILKATSELKEQTQEGPVAGIVSRGSKSSAGSKSQKSKSVRSSINASSKINEGVLEESVISSVKNLDIEDKKKKDLEKEMKRKGMILPENNIPTHYKDGRVHGKGGCIYKRHGALCLQTQNYPNAIYHKKFPSCVLNPGETYKHTIVYKFYKQAGNPNKWIKQYNHDLKKKCINVSKI